MDKIKKQFKCYNANMAIIIFFLKNISNEIKKTMKILDAQSFPAFEKIIVFNKIEDIPEWLELFPDWNYKINNESRPLYKLNKILYNLKSNYYIIVNPTFSINHNFLFDFAEQLNITHYIKSNNEN